MLNDLLNTGKDIINRKVNNRWEQYLNFIKKNSSYEDVLLETAYASADAFDLYATFTKMGIAERFHYPLLRLNGYRNPSEFTGENRKLKIYAADFMESIYVKYISID